MDEPFFWEDYIIDEPITNNLIRNWRFIKYEMLLVKRLLPKFLDKYPVLPIKDPTTGKRVKLYDNKWLVTPVSLLDEDYSSEVKTINKRLGKVNLDDLLKKYRPFFAPFLHNAIKKPEAEGILANSFYSVLSPGTIIRPHKGYSKKYMRIHLCLIDDENCMITVGNETKTWKCGNIIAFKDGGPYYHSVAHNGNRDRYVLSVDLKLDYLKQYTKGL